MLHKLTITTAIAAMTLALSAVPLSASPLVPANKACFFPGIGFTGAGVCFEPGQRQFLPSDFAQFTASIQIIGNVSVTLCTGRIKRGSCMTFDQDRWQVPSPFHNTSKSYQVQRNFAEQNFNQPATTAAHMMVMSFARLVLD